MLRKACSAEHTHGGERKNTQCRDELDIRGCRARYGEVAAGEWKKMLAGTQLSPPATIRPQLLKGVQCAGRQAEKKKNRAVRKPELRWSGVATDPQYRGLPR